MPTPKQLSKTGRRSRSLRADCGTADAVRLYGGNAIWKDVAQWLLDTTCQQRTGRHEEDGCWPAFETP
jgi:hypothetical protein